MRLALFDLDNTLLAGDSDYEWGQFLVDRGVLARDTYEAQNRTYYEQYVAGTLDIHEYLGFALRPLAEHSPEALAGWHAEFMKLRIAPMITGAARALVRRHLEAERRSAVAARATWQQLVEAMTLLRRTAAQARPALTLDITVDAVGKLLDARRELHPAALEREIDRVENDVRASVRRLQDLVIHAQSVEAIAEIERMARAGGFGGCSAQLQHHAGQNLVGWRLNFEKPS